MKTGNLVLCSLALLVLGSACVSSMYIPVRLLAKLIPATVMYGSFLSTAGISKVRLPPIRLGHHHDGHAVHVYPTEHIHKLVSHSAHAVHSDHHVGHISHGHHDLHHGSGGGGLHLGGGGGGLSLGLGSGLGGGLGSELGGIGGGLGGGLGL